MIAAGGQDRNVRVWTVRPEEEGKQEAGGDSRKTKPFKLSVIKSEKLGEHEGDIWSVRWNVTGTVLATSGDDGRVKLWKQMITDKVSSWAVVVLRSALLKILRSLYWSREDHNGKQSGSTSKRFDLWMRQSLEEAVPGKGLDLNARSHFYFCITADVAIHSTAAAFCDTLLLLSHLFVMSFIFTFIDSSVNGPSAVHSSVALVCGLLNGGGRVYTRSGSYTHHNWDPAEPSAIPEGPPRRIRRYDWLTFVPSMISF